MWIDNKQLFQGASEIVDPRRVGLLSRVEVVLLTEADGVSGVQHYSVDLTGHLDVQEIVVEQQLCGWQAAHQIGAVPPNATGPTEWEVIVTEGTVVSATIALRRGDPRAGAGAAAWPIRVVVDDLPVAGALQFECAEAGTAEPQDRTVQRGGQSCRATGRRTV